jgi:hypothetical protein
MSKDASFLLDTFIAARCPYQESISRINGILGTGGRVTWRRGVEGI